MARRLARERAAAGCHPTLSTNTNNTNNDESFPVVVERGRKRRKTKSKKADRRYDSEEDDLPAYSTKVAKKRRRTKQASKKKQKQQPSKTVKTAKTAATAAASSSSSRRQRKKDTWIAQTTQIIQTQVFQAAAVVAQALSSGPWPSAVLPVNDNEDEGLHNNKSSSRCYNSGDSSSSSNNNNDDESLSPVSQLQDQHISHMSIVGASLQQFATDVVLPSILHAVQDDVPPIGLLVQPDQSWRRPLLGTFLMLREVLIQNGDAIFGRGHLLLGKLQPEQQQDKVAATTAAAAAANAAWFRMPYDILLTDPTVLFGVRILATSIILHAIELLHEWNVEVIELDLAEQFLSLAHAYDRGDGSVFAKGWLTGGVMQSTPALLRTGEPISFEHAKSYKYSFQACLKRHPLSPSKNSTAPAVSEPNAVHVTVLQNAL